MSSALDKYDFFDPKIVEWPYDLYRLMRREAPVCKIVEKATGREIYMITPYDLVQHVFRTPDVYSNRHASILLAGGSENPEADAVLKQGWPEMDTFDSDPPGHTRYRSLANKAFSPKAVMQMTGFIGGIVDDLIDEFIERGECDFVKEFAVPLPIYAIMGILGVGREYKDSFQAWSDAFGVMMSHMNTAEEEVDAAWKIVAFQKFAREVIDARRSKPGDDIISALIHAKGDNDEPQLNDNELLSMIRQFMLAGSETTRNTTTAGLGLLLRHPEQLTRLLGDPSLLSDALDEVLRYHSPVCGIWRIVRKDVELAGTHMPAGALAMIRIDSANHDETQFANPDVFDIMRPDLRNHVAFGQGIHVCIGAALARREMLEAFSRTLSRLKKLAIVEEKTDLSNYPGLILRAPRGLHIRFDPGPRLRPAARMRLI